MLNQQCLEIQASSQAQSWPNFSWGGRGGYSEAELVSFKKLDEDIVYSRPWEHKDKTCIMDLGSFTRQLS